MNFLGKYACILEEQEFDGSHPLMEHHELYLHVNAVWNRAGKVGFYMICGF